MRCGLSGPGAESVPGPAVMRGCRGSADQQRRPVYQAPLTSDAEPIQVTPGPTHCSEFGPQSSISITMCEPSLVQWL
ncbi:hypothetical protein CP970_29830 [Streptomyces kanamyceticus]|uniref:Uncharacterized protein n=1 Tax=Streptomyces kanamyceticus TaxID=1967 RepID=A0A5J6GL38_STRKN|nr:hypothetical protein CP970_29830 [Streptomyces kanamyceticus]